MLQTLSRHNICKNIHIDENIHGAITGTYFVTVSVVCFELLSLIASFVGDDMFTVALFTLQYFPSFPPALNMLCGLQWRTYQCVLSSTRGIQR